MRALTVLQPASAPAGASRRAGAAATNASQPRSVRLSLTDRCDLACVYCRPHKQDGYVDERLDLAAWKTMVDGLVSAGVRRVRLTGGEPLLHQDLVPVIAYLGTIGLDDLAITTNATRLEKLARPLREAGLRRVNVSLDSLDPERFRRMTRGGKLDVVLRGIDAALAAGFDEIKLNAVIVKGENDVEVEALVRWSWDRGIVPRLLEVMAIGEGAKLADRVVTASEMRVRLAHVLESGDAEREQDRGPARYLRARHDAAKKVGFITGASDTYCKGCDRLRVASDGMLRPCLATNDGLSASSVARSGDAAGVASAVAEAWTLKPDGESFKGCTESSAAEVSMRGIGG
ncbi:MAG: Molybdenum cofactor biosynthesis protein MoaA [Labilithrix sp.]|nr:Molybdenum cofactor biosynthesis protein MoaA [Labilithrix sp.]